MANHIGDDEKENTDETNSSDFHHAHRFNSNSATAESSPPPLSVAFEFLTDRYDRFLLYFLMNRDDPATIGEITDQIVVWGTQTSKDQFDRESKSQISTKLYHSTIPKLAEHDLATFHREDRSVKLTDAGKQLEPYLEFAKDREPEPVQQAIQRNEG